MRKTIILRYLTLLFVFTIISCSKNNERIDPDTVDTGYPQSLSGSIYYKWATEGILKIDLPGGTGGAFISDDSRLNSFDVSRDGKLKLTAHNTSTVGNYKVKFTLSNIADGGIVQQFDYTSPAGNSFCEGFLSPDNSLILVQSNDTEEDGVTVLRVNGEFVVRLEGVGGEPFSMHDIQLWLPGNSLILTHGNNILRLDPPYNEATLIRTMQYSDWKALTVNQQGTQLAMHIANHIHTMDMDGSNLRQVTTSDFVESMPVFSPDGTYLLIGSNYRVTGPLGHSWDLKLIPNDGRQYNVDPVQANSDGVIPVIWKGKDKIETASGQILWK